MKKNIPIEEVLNSIADIQRAEPAPFLYTRVKARMANQNESEAWYVLDRKRAVVVVAMLLVLFVANIFLMNQAETTTTAGTNELESFATSFNLSGNGYSY
jgi:hypothetical protein